MNNNKKLNLNKTKEFAKNIRINTLNMITSSKSSHIGSCFSIADVLSVLFVDVMKYNNKLFNEKTRDRLIFSKGHASAIYYSALAEAGFFSKKKLKLFCEDGSDLFGHVTRNRIPGVEVSSGSLGHGLSIAAGMAISMKKDKINNRIFCIISDGECNEGSTWEAALFAGHHKLNNITLIIDYNKIQSFGRISEVLNLNSLEKKWQSFNWSVKKVDGHSLSQLSKILKSKKSIKPQLIIANTVKGKGVSFMENQLKWHYKSPNNKEYLLALDQLK